VKKMVKLDKKEIETSEFYKNEKLTPDNVKEGNLYTFTSPGQWFEGIGQEGSYKFFVIDVFGMGQDYSVKLNKQSLSKIVKVFGEETEDWKDKQVLFNVIEAKYRYLLASPIMPAGKPKK